jgi:hypothetical protein
MCDISTTQRYDRDHARALDRHHRARSGGVVTALMARPHAVCAAPRKSAAPQALIEWFKAAVLKFGSGHPASFHRVPLSQGFWA